MLPGVLRDGVQLHVLYWEGDCKETYFFEPEDLLKETKHKDGPGRCFCCGHVAETWRQRLDNMQSTLRMCLDPHSSMFRQDVASFHCLSPKMRMSYSLRQFYTYLRAIGAAATVTENDVLGTAMAVERAELNASACGIEVQNWNGVQASDPRPHEQWLQNKVQDMNEAAKSRGGSSIGLLLDKDGCEVSSFGTSLPMFAVPPEPIREVLILLGGPRGIESEELVRLMAIFSGAGTWTGPGFTQGLMKIRLPGGLHHSCVALNDLLSFHDKGYLIPVVEDYKGLGEARHRVKSAAMNSAITAWATSSLPAKSKCEALQRFAWKVQHSCLDRADSSSNQRWAVVAGDEEPATPNEVSSYLDKLQATGQFPRDTPWRSQWRLTMCLEAIEPARALKVLRECHRRSLKAARCGAEFHPWEELAFDLDEALRSAPSKKDRCPRDVRSALLKARAEIEVAEEEEDLFPDADMMLLLGELPCEQAAQLLQNCCSNPQESMLYLSHSIANAIMRHQGGLEADLQLRLAIKAFLNSAEYEGRDEEAYEKLKQTCHKPRRQRWFQPPEQLALGDVPRTVPEPLPVGELPGGSDAETKPPKVIRPPFRAKAPAAAKAGAKAAAKATSKATAKAAAKSFATAQAKTLAKAQAKTQAKAQAKTQAKTPLKLAKAQPKASAKAETKRKLPLPKKLQQPPPPKRSIWLPRLQKEGREGREVKIVVVVPANALAICHLFSLSSLMAMELFCSKISSDAEGAWLDKKLHLRRCLIQTERNEDIGGPEDQIIALSSLPEPVATRYYRMKRKMEKIRDAALDRLEDLRRQKLIEAGIGLEQIENTRRSGRRSSQLALADGDDVPHQDDEDDRIPTSSEMATIIVNRVQLQRMLDEDPRLAEICSSDKAVDVVRRFRVDQTGDDPFEVVARLQALGFFELRGERFFGDACPHQASVAEKLNAIESIATDLAFDEVETLRVMSQELHSALTESQKEWRAELLSVLQLASLLSNALIDLTKKIEQVQLNHTELAIRAAPLTIGKK
ncbi:unnamed protein product [Symbiodinium sp. CCMP2592]|nr:unnamed protein product [Symbiodinium sp. CCMP2592]